MLELENIGMLEKTHTSSGRVPSAKGYRYYIDNLREEFEDERASLLAYICAKYKIPLVDMNNTVEEWEENKEKFMEDRLCH